MARKQAVRTSKARHKPATIVANRVGNEHVMKEVEDAAMG
jgi:hypothetical protein